MIFVVMKDLLCVSPAWNDDDSPVVLTITTLSLSFVKVDFGCKCGIRTINGLAHSFTGLFIMGFFSFGYFYSCDATTNTNQRPALTNQ